MSDRHWPLGAFVAEFSTEQQFAGAVKALRDRGYTQVETYSSYPVHDLDDILPAHPSVLPGFVFLSGLGGGAFSYWVQWYTNAVSYRLNIGGRPAHAAPAFFIPTFEGTVLIASCAAFFGLLALLRLPRPWHPIFEMPDVERAAIDHYFVAISAADARADRELTPRDLESLGAVRVTTAPSTE